MADLTNEHLTVDCWEVELLSEFCCIGTNCLDKIGYGAGSLFASSLYVAASCSRLQLLGASLEEEMEIREWVEFYCTRIRHPLPWQHISKESLNSSLEVLEAHLSKRIYLTGSSISVADVLLYYGLYQYMRELSYGDKQSYMNVSRWFDQIQHSPGVKPFTWFWIPMPKT